MSQPDLLDELRASRPVAPSELRERVQSVAASAPAPPRMRLTWRRASFALVPALAALLVAAIVVGGRGGADRSAAPAGSSVDAATETLPATGIAVAPSGVRVPHDATTGAAAAESAQKTLSAPATPGPTPGRVVRYSSYLELRVRTPDGVARAAQRALAVAHSLGGYPASTTIDATGGFGTADLVLRIPRAHVQEAVARLSALGTIVGEHVSIQDLQAGLNTTDRTIARLQRLLRTTRALPQTEPTRRTIASTTKRIARLQRGSAKTVRDARFATIELQVHTRRSTVHPTPHGGHGPLHGLAVTFRWLGIGAVYALALGVPLLLLAVLAWLAVRAVRRRREDALLSST